MNNFWHWYITIIVIINLLGYGILLYFTKKIKSNISSNENLDHSFDGIHEQNNPLPQWWIGVFILSIIFAFVYLIFYPGLGKNIGILKWTSYKQWKSESELINKNYENLFSSYKNIEIEKLIKNPKAIKIGKNLYLNNCSMCHGINAQGARGFPNLSINFFRYGERPNDIKNSITNGRKGIMPPMSNILTDEDIKKIASYVMYISNNNYEKSLIKEGEEKFKTICFTCHGVNATGNKFIGAPDLTKGIRMYGTDLNTLIKTIKYGRVSVMPSHKDILSYEEIHLLTAYIYNLSNH